MRGTNVLLIVLDFDGTLVKENSSRLCEKLLINDCENLLCRIFFNAFFLSKTYLNLLLFKIFAIFGYLLKTDFRRMFILSIIQKYKRKHTTKYILRKAVKSLHINDRLWKYIPTKDVKIVILSNGLDIIIKEFCKLHALNVKYIFATRTSIYGDNIKIEHQFYHNKHQILEIINRTLKPDSIIFISDNEEDIALKDRLKCPKIHVFDVLDLLNENESKLSTLKDNILSTNR